MATLRIDVDDTIIDNVAKAFADAFGWNSDLGITRRTFLKQKLMDYMVEVTEQVESVREAEAAREAKRAEIRAYRQLISDPNP